MTAPEVMLPVAYRVRARSEETRDTVTLELTRHDGASTPFVPGQFNMLAPFGVGEAAISIAGDPAHPDTLVHTVRSVGAVTRALCSLGPGDLVGVRGPYGTGWPLDAASGRDVVIVAGGIGLAPVRPAILHVLANRGAYADVSIIYGARTPADLLYEEDLHRWRARFDVHTDITVDRASAGWHGDVGFVTKMLAGLTQRTTEPVVMMCGPEIMMKSVAERLVHMGAGAADLYLSLERNMKCGVGFCGHCQYGPDFICRTGPVLGYDQVGPRLDVKEL